MAILNLKCVRIRQNATERSYLTCCTLGYLLVAHKVWQRAEKSAAISTFENEVGVLEEELLERVGPVDEAMNHLLDPVFGVV